MLMRGCYFSLIFILLQSALLCADTHPAHLLMGHVKVLQELKDRFAANKQSPAKKPKRKPVK